MKILHRVSMFLFLAALAALGQEVTGSIAGKVIDATGASIPRAQIRLTSESGGRNQVGGSTNEQGEFSFTGLSAGAYTVETFMPGFVHLAVKGVQVAQGAKVNLPAFSLQVGQIGCGGPWPVDYFRILPNEEKLGSISGTIQTYDGPLKGVTSPIEGATVKILCSKGGLCGQTMTDANGAFLFSGIYPENVSLQVTAKGYYPHEEFGLTADAGWERNYGRFSLERCRNKKCDPSKLPKKVAICE